MNSSMLRQQRKCFTLVEMLIVLALIGILAAILLPVFARVREAARSTVCQSNLHQIGFAMQLYETDHNNRYPPCQLTPNCYYPDALMPYTKSRTIFSCPDVPEDVYYSACSTPEIKDAALLSYHGSYVLNIPDGREYISGARISNPSIFFLAVEGHSSIARTSVQDGSGRISDEAISHTGLKFSHNGSANALFADGHTKWLPKDEWQNRSHWNFAGQE